MKKIIFLILSIVAFKSVAVCTNFSGQYQLDSSESVEMQIVQNQCESLKLIIKNDRGVFVDEYQMDAKRVKYAEYPEIGLVTYVTPLFKNGDIIIQVENIWIDTGKGDKFLRRIHLDFSSKTILLDQRGQFRDDGVFIPSTQQVYQKL